jgi:serine/threonine protein phosphatase PrpC
MTRPWSAFTATQVGSSHRLSDLPNQDASLVAVEDGLALVGVADGHGHRTHFRSREGAWAAVQTVAELLGPAKDLDAEALDDLLGGPVRSSLVPRWRARVLTHAAEQPCTGDELSLLGGSSPDHLVLAYGTTVVAAVSTGRALGLVQLGDGDAVVAFTDGEVVQPLPEDPLLDGHRTTSLCQPDATSSLRTAVLDLTRRPVGLCFVATDGFGSPRLDTQRWWVQVAEELTAHVAAHGSDWVESKLPEWLVEPAETGGDDTTVAVLVAPSDGYSPLSQ